MDSAHSVVVPIVGLVITGLLSVGLVAVYRSRKNNVEPKTNTDILSEKILVIIASSTISLILSYDLYTHFFPMAGGSKMTAYLNRQFLALCYVGSALAIAAAAAAAGIVLVSRAGPSPAEESED